MRSVLTHPIKGVMLIQSRVAFRKTEPRATQRHFLLAVRVPKWESARISFYGEGGVEPLIRPEHFW